MVPRKKKTKEKLDNPEEKKEFLYLTIAYENFSLETTKLNILDRMCEDCNKEHSSTTISSMKDIIPMIRQISKCCSQKNGYISIHTSMNEGIIREVLAAGNKPINSEKVSASLKNHWALTPFPKNIDKTVIERLATSNDWIATSISEA